MSAQPEAGPRPDAAAKDPAPRDRRGTYIAVVVVELIVVLGLWALGRYFTG